MRREGQNSIPKNAEIVTERVIGSFFRGSTVAIEFVATCISDD